MAKTLVVVESPAKARTINRYLGKDYQVVASMGHIRDLPKTRLGVDVEAGFSPAYEPIPARKKVIKQLKDAARGASRIYVATDPDREGEAIGWHLAREVGAKKEVGRLMFNEITRTAVAAALERVGEIDQRMVDAQQARRVLDRLVGYKLSPLLWDKVQRGLSAGRVQSVALKLVCDREAAIDAFQVEEYWHVTARLAAGQPPEFDARLVKKGKQAVKLGREAEAKAAVADLEKATYVVESVATKERKRHAAPPFITSKLQQASRFPVKRTMQIAQQLYEGIEIPGEGSVGLITYMRTDSTRVSEQAIASVRDYIRAVHGPEFLPARPKRYQAGKDAQDAHEAIRPTSMTLAPAEVRPHLTREQAYLYELIWNRFVASQMPPATFDDTTVEVRAGDYLLRAKGSVPKFSGWLAVYERTPPAESEPRASADAGTGAGEAAAGGLLPPMRENDRLELKGLLPEQKFTQPPPRFGEATLVKELEENGIGRPSTYASIIGTLQAREYVEKIEGRFKPTKLGRLVTDLLTRSFDDIIQVAYTRDLETRLDRIEEGRADYQGTLASFYEKFRTDLEKAVTAMPNVKAEGLPERRDLRQVRVEDGPQGRPLRDVPGLQRLPGVSEHARGGAGRRGGRGAAGDLRCLRAADGRQAGSLRPVPGVLGLPRVQDHAQADRHRQGRGRGEAGSPAGRALPEVRCEPDGEARAVRRVHRLQQLPQVPLREAREHRGRLPARRRRPRRAQVAARARLLRMQQLPGLRLHALEQAARDAVPEVRGTLPAREGDEALGPAVALPQ